MLKWILTGALLVAVAGTASAAGESPLMRKPPPNIEKPAPKPSFPKPHIDPGNRPQPTPKMRAY